MLNQSAAGIMFKQILLFSLVATIQAQQKSQASSYASVNNLVIGSTHSGKTASGGHYRYAHHYPKYEYKYGVDDQNTKDVKSQFEHRDGDLVEGEYTLLQSDGRIRTVHYTADKDKGFSVNVTYKINDVKN